MVKKDPQQALELFRKTCEEMKLSESCLALGNMYLTGKGEYQISPPPVPQLYMYSYHLDVINRKVTANYNYVFV